jgi:hypothetical protein
MLKPHFFEKYTFLEFFDTERIIDDEAGISIFTVSLRDGFLFSLYVSPHEEYVSLKLTKEDLDKPIFEISLSHLGSISCDAESLHFFKEKDQSRFPYQDVHIIKPFWSVKIKPSVHLQLEIK